MSILFCFPNEILVEIFSYLDDPPKSKLKDYLFLCKKLYPVVAEAYYRKVILSRNGYTLFTTGKIKPGSQAAVLARQTRSLEVLLGGLKPDSFDKLLTYFPNLEILGFDNINCARALSTKSAGQNPLRRIKRLEYEFINLDNPIEDPNEAKKKSIVNMFLQYRYRATLTHVILLYYGRIKDTNLDLFSYINSFRQLTHLELRDETKEAYNFFNILQHNPSLVSIRYYNLRKQDKVYLQQQVVSEETLAISASDSFDDDMNTLIYNKDLVEVDLALSTITKPYLGFILNHCQNLDKLMLAMFDEDLFAFIDRIGQKKFDKLLSKLTLANSSQLWAAPKRGVFNQCDKEKTQLDRLFKLAHKIRNKRPLTVTLTLIDSSDKTAGIKVTDNQSMFLSFSVMYDDIGHPPRPMKNARQEGLREMLEGIYGEIEFNDGRSSLNPHQRIEYDSGCMDDEYEHLSVPKSTATQSGLEIVHHFSWKSARDCARVPFNLLKYALEHCPDLKSLDLRFGCHCGCIKVGHEGNDVDKTLREGHPYLLFSRGEYLHPEQLRLLSQYYPNIERIEAGNDGRLPLSLGHHVFDKATLDFTCFKNLKSIAIDIYMHKISFHSQEYQMLTEMKHIVHTIVRINYQKGPKSKKPLLFTIWQEDPYMAGRSHMFPVAHAQSGTLEELIEKHRRYLPSILVVDIYLERELESLVILHDEKVAIIQPYKERRTLEWTKDHSIRVHHDYFVNEYHMNIDHKSRKK
ncbi:hypothetical protein EDC96DRAFT_506701 [Choanephora cucurbitarum]|nr:hypothetical protein EDC96DRAFT_506701 [Choanephora cucurbitarum]